MVKQLDRGPDAAPLHSQLRMELQRLAQTLTPGDRFPTDRELNDLFRVSRTTIHQAVAELVRSGHLTRVQGKGTFVSRPKFERGEPRLNSFTEDMRSKGYEPSNRLLHHELVVPSLEVQQCLRLDEKERVLYLERLMLADGEPMAVHYTYLPERLCLNFDEWFSPAALSGGSVYQALENRCGYRLTEADETIESTVAKAKEAKLLGIQRGAPLLWLERITYMENGWPIEFSLLIYRADRYKLAIKTRRQGGGGDPGLMAGAGVAGIYQQRR